MAKQKTPALLTPRGRAIYPHLTTPDTKFDSVGTYSVKLAVPTVLAESLIQQIDAEFAKALKQAKEDNPKKRIKEADLPYQTNPENDDETIFNFKMKAAFKAKDGNMVSMSPAIFDAKGKPCPKGIKIGGGSTLRISFEPSGFYTATVGAGVSLRLKAVQVIELREFGGGGNAQAFGFEAEEDGFSADDEEETTVDKGETEDTSGSDNEGDESADVDGSDF